MALSPKLELRQGQALVMTPQLQQAIKLLQLSNLELAEYVESEVEQNPLLEQDEPREEREGDPVQAASDTGDQSSDTNVSSLEMSEMSAESGTSDSPLDMDMNEALGSDEPVAGQQSLESERLIRSGGGRSDLGGGNFDVDQSLSGEISLKDHLTAQLGENAGSPIDRIIGVHLVDMVNEAGYLTAGTDAVADIVGCEPEQVEATLKKLQGFDPVGVFARSLAECLTLQLKDRNRFDPVMEALLDNLDLLAQNDARALAKACGVGAEDIAEMIAEIKALNPKPGFAFGSEAAQTVVPDVYILARPTGGWMVELNSDTLPRVLVNTRYYSRINTKSRSDTDRAYLSEKLNSANWLIKSLDQRANTILKVATEIVVQQEEFLTHGVQRLRPMVLRDIATAIEMHESTVSRVTANKYLSTTRGIYPMKYFFTSAIASADGSTVHSAESVRSKIKTMIDDEPPNATLSDEKIVEILRRVDIKIARRTVAKYRDTMRILPSADRRRAKKNGLI
jgi:RNA polymerase sigma-54 factor